MVTQPDIAGLHAAGVGTLSPFAKSDEYMAHAKRLWRAATMALWRANQRAYRAVVEYATYCEHRGCGK